MRLTFDVFSGKPNPSWQLPPIVSRQVFDLINDTGLLRQLTAAEFPVRLGYRGTQIVLPPEIAVQYRLPNWLNLSADTFDHSALFRELATIARLMSFIGMDEFLNAVCSSSDCC